MTTTQNLHLPQWEADDRIMRTDFNDAMASIDAVVAAQQAATPRIVFGTYVGDGAETRTITLDFTPRIVYLCNNNGWVYSAGSNYRSFFGGLFFQQAPIIDEYQNIIHQIVANGFTVRCKEDTSHSHIQGYFSNENGQTYRYVAIG